jgi:hypothetical protein
MNKPNVGDKIFSLNVGNAARNCGQVLKPVEVLKVGRKYFTAGDPNWRHSNIQYHIHDWTEKTDYSPVSILYRVEQEYYDEKEAREIVKEISQVFKWNNCPDNISLEDLREIKRIINK